MKTEIRRSALPGCYDLYVNGVLRMADESIQVVVNVEESLLRGTKGDPSECDEVAEAIRADLNRQT